MSRSDTFDELRRANPRSSPGFERSLLAADVVRARIVAPPAAPGRDTIAAGFGVPPPARRPRIVVRAAGTLVAVAAVASLVAIGLPGGGGVQSAAAAVNEAAAATAASARASGTVTVTITHNGELWATKKVRWNEGDVAIVDGSPGRPGGGELRVVGDMLYGIEDGRWIELGDPDSIDPESGTTPQEHLAAARDDVAGTTLVRITEGMADDLTTRQLEDGSTVYLGTVVAGLVAEADVKGDEPIRVFPFGYVAHDEASDPANPVAVAFTVGSDELIREMVVNWGAGRSVWTYTVTYRDLGATPPIEAPENAQRFPSRTPAAPPNG